MRFNLTLRNVEVDIVAFSLVFHVASEHDVKQRLEILAEELLRDHINEKVVCGGNERLPPGGGST